MVADSKSTALTVYERMPDSLAAVQTLGAAIAKSGMFGCGSIEQGQVLALECMARRMPPLTLAERYHVVQGKLMMKYDAMLAAFHELGGKHRIIARTSEEAKIELTIDGQTLVESLTWEEAKKEKWPFKSDGKTLKDNWSTDRSRRQMLWARVVSEGVRALCPGVNNGRYVTEEIDDGDDSPAAAAASNGNGKHSASVVDQAAAAASSPAAASPPVVEGEFVIKESTESATTVVETLPEKITDAQLRRLRELESQLMCGEQINKVIAARKIGSARELAYEDAVKILAKLEEKYAAAQAAASQSTDAMAGQSSIPAEAREISTAGPATQQQIDAITNELRKLAQTNPEVQKDFMAKLTAKLKSSGKSRLKDLSANDAAKLYHAVTIKNLQAFIDLTLEAYVAPAEAASDATKN